MTRINLIPPEELMDQHLFAEWREMKMIPRSLLRTMKAVYNKNPPDPSPHNEVWLTLLYKKIPPRFTLNTGHVTFFYDKAHYIKQRYTLLTHELIKRDYKFDQSAPVDPLEVWSMLPPLFHQDYTPTQDALALIRNRIKLKIAQRPYWYRYYGKLRPKNLMTKTV